MTERQFAYLFKYSSRLGIKTMGELAAYKRRRGAKTNGDLIAAMWSDLQAAEKAPA